MCATHNTPMLGLLSGSVAWWTLRAADVKRSLYHMHPSLDRGQSATSETHKSHQRDPSLFAIACKETSPSQHSFLVFTSRASHFTVGLVRHYKAAFFRIPKGYGQHFALGGPARGFRSPPQTGERGAQTGPRGEGFTPPDPTSRRRTYASSATAQRQVNDRLNLVTQPYGYGYYSTGV